MMKSRNKFQPGDHAIVWREKHLRNGLNYLLGKEVVILGKQKPKTIDWFAFNIDDFGNAVIRDKPNQHIYMVREYESDNDSYLLVDGRAMTKTTKKIEVGSWDDCPFVPKDLK